MGPHGSRGQSLPEANAEGNTRATGIESRFLARPFDSLRSLRAGFRRAERGCNHPTAPKPGALGTPVASGSE